MVTLRGRKREWTCFAGQQFEVGMGGQICGPGMGSPSCSYVTGLPRVGTEQSKQACFTLSGSRSIHVASHPQEAPPRPLPRRSISRGKRSSRLLGFRHLLLGKGSHFAGPRCKGGTAAWWKGEPRKCGHFAADTKSGMKEERRIEDLMKQMLVVSIWMSILWV